jgi:hypothetical protein
VVTLGGGYEGQPNGTNFTVANSDDNGDSAAANVTLLSGTAVYSTDQAMFGTNSLALTRSSTNQIYVVHDLGTPAATGKFRRWIYLTGAPSVTADFPFRFVSSADVTQATIQMTSTRILRISAGTSVQGTVPLALNTWYRIEVQWTNITASGTIACQAYVGNTTTLVDSISLGSLTLTAFQKCRNGCLSAGAPSTTTYYDDHPSGFMSDANATPFGVAVTGPTGGTFRYIDALGAAQPASVYYVDGAGAAISPAQITWA